MSANPPGASELGCCTRDVRQGARRAVVAVPLDRRGQYSDGSTATATYDQVTTKTTGHAGSAEVVSVDTSEELRREDLTC